MDGFRGEGRKAAEYNFHFHERLTQPHRDRASEGAITLFTADLQAKVPWLG